MRTLCSVLLFVFTVQPIQAICVIFDFNTLLAREATRAVFTGTIREVQTVATKEQRVVDRNSGAILERRMLPAAQLVTFEVDRMWKGQLPSRTVVYYDIPGGEFGPLVTGKRYLVSAYLHDAGVAERPREVPPDTLETNGCGVTPADDTYLKEYVGGRSGYPPSQKP